MKATKKRMTKPYTETARFKRLANEYLKEDAKMAKVREKGRIKK
jgi:hypothetical protein